jgi:rubrerythrin
MESNKTEILLKKYFEGESSIEEERELRKYFASANVAPHLEKYKTMFGYFSDAAAQKSKQEIKVPNMSQDKKRNRIWLSIAASIVVILGAGSYVYFDSQVSNQDLGTYDNPEAALKETQKALAMLSNNVNVGIVSVIALEEYEESKNLIFKE